jgi:hypothetical protein
MFMTNRGGQKKQVFLYYVFIIVNNNNSIIFSIVKRFASKCVGSCCGRDPTREKAAGKNKE